MQPNEEYNYSNNIIAGMSGFTSDFFGALETTLTDNSINNSKLDLSQSNVNKSQIMRELREQNMAKIAQKLTKMIISIALEQIYMYGVRKVRRTNKNQLNIYRRFYSLNLKFNLKDSALCKGAFYRIQKFVQQNDMRTTAPLPNNPIQQSTNSPTPVQQSIVKKSQRQTQQFQQLIQELIITQNKLKSFNILFAFSKLKNALKSNNNIIQQTQPQNKLFNGVIAMETILNYKYNIRLGFKSIKNYEYYLQKKSYLIQCLAVIVNSQMRGALILIYKQSNQKGKVPIKDYQLIANNEKKIKQQAKLIIQKSLPIQQTQLRQQGRNKKQNNSQYYGLQSKIKFKKAGKSNVLELQMNSKQTVESDQKVQTPNKIGRPKSGLKFNRLNKKKSEPGQKIEEWKNSKTQRTSIGSTPILKRQQSIIIKPAHKNAKVIILKAMKTQVRLVEPNFPNNIKWKDFTVLQKTYHLPQQQFKVQVPDIPDKIMLLEDSLTESRSSSLGERLTFSKRLHKIDNKKPLQFSNKKKSKSKHGSEKSKKSVLKSDDQQIQNMNFQSLKSYYFPQQQQFGKAITGHDITDRQFPTKFIGSSNWAGQSKKRVATQSNLRTVKSNQKINPYLQQLKQKNNKKQIQRKCSNNNRNSERSVSVKSGSKISKQQQKRLQQNYQTNVNTRQQSRAVTRNVTPKDARQFQTKKQIPNVPRQWNFYHNSSPNLASPAHPTSDVRYQKSPLQFQRISSKAVVKH